MAEAGSGGLSSDVREGGLTRHQRRFFAIAAGLVTLAWVMLFIWESSPYGRYLEHGDWTQLGLAKSICSALPAGEFLFPLMLYVGGWMLMLAAMMLPTTLPLIDIFRRLVRHRPERGRLVALLIVGYLSVWLLFGLAAHFVDYLLQEAAAESIWLTLNGWIVGGIVLIGAGAFQFSALKYRCLDRCRTPMGFVMSHWHGERPSVEALRLGFDHGIFCVGCCWALMLLMFVVGTGNVGFMLLLGAVMAIEKNLPWGRRLARPVGVLLVGWGGLTLAQGVGLFAI